MKLYHWEIGAWVTRRSMSGWTSITNVAMAKVNPMVSTTSLMAVLGTMISPLAKSIRDRFHSWMTSIFWWSRFGINVCKVCFLFCKSKKQIWKQPEMDNFAINFDGWQIGIEKQFWLKHVLSCVVFGHIVIN